MKLKVDLDDFYLDEEDDLVPAIKDFVVIKVTSTIWDLSLIHISEPTRH